MNFRKNKKSGISILETLIYAAILTIVLFVIALISLSLIKSHRVVALNRDLESNASFAMERMIREIRLANSINVGLSSFAVSPGTLTLQGSSNGSSYSLRFDVSNGQVRITRNSDPSSFMTSSNISVKNLVFQKTENSNSEGVRIVLELEGSKGDYTKSLKLDGFSVLRGSY